ncbi:DUF5337 domain-containing protein [Rhodobacteraceae bacterium XHP0102]|nr:DUF5337 domain-containing protein [Rhodobacteraceae bacterium XHP0102]
MPQKPHKPSPQEAALDRKGRIAALVIAGAMLAWMLLQLIGAHMNWPLRVAFLFDLAAMAALFWALVVTYQVWQGRKALRSTDAQLQNDKD